MHKAPADGATLLDWGVAAVAHPGEAESGDLYLVRSVEGGVLVAVVDGLGHGTEAATAARLAIAALARHAHESPLSLFERTHQALKGTRGAVMSLAFFRRTDPSVIWLGGGNVAGTLVPPHG